MPEHPVRAALESLFADCKESLDVSTVLRSIQADIESLEVRQHPLGFLHYLIEPLAPLPNVKARLHVWDSESMERQDGIATIHDHMWALTSTVLVGSLTDVVYEPAATGEWRAWPIQVEYRDTGELLVPSGTPIHVTVADTRPQHAGDRYELDPGVLHETIVETVPTATLVLAEYGSGPPQPRLLSRQPLSTPVETSRQPVSIERAEAALEVCLAHARA